MTIPRTSLPFFLNGAIEVLALWGFQIMFRAVKMALKLLASASLLGLPAVLMAVPASASHSWNNYHWARTANPFALQLYKNTSLAWSSSRYVEQAASDWSAVPPTTLTTPPGQVLTATVGSAGTQDPRKCPPTNGKVQVCSYNYGYRGWLGVAQIWLSGSHITQGTVKLNDSYFSLSTYDTPAWRHLVACQEIGHTFGLDHQDVINTNPNLGTCMDYTKDPAGAGSLGPLSNEHPNQHDYDELAIIYNHGDSTTTVSLTVVALGQPADDWGRAVRFTKSGKGRIFVKDLGGNQQVVTFVLWATD